VVILHVVAPAQVGGLERVVQTLATGQRAAGHEVHVAVVCEAPDADDGFVAPLRESGVTVHQVCVRRRDYRRERAEITRLCQRLRPSVVHTHGYRPDVLDADAARRCGVPAVSTVHGFTGGGLRNRLYERVQRAALKRLDAVIAVSRPLGVELQRSGVPLESLHVVPNAFRDADPPLERSDARMALNLPLDGLVAGWVGRISPEKGLDVLIEAMEQLPGLPLTLAVIGDGPHRPGLELRAERAGLRDIRWYGVVPDAGRLFRAFDVFVLSSRTEGTPMVLFEAMAAKVPIIATRVGGVPDILSGAEAALVPAEDPVALAGEIRTVCARPATATMRARAARRRLLREFRVQPWVARHDSIYLSVQRPLPVRASA
jgi:glycosyltransferase involved in cell wall biosynthesis